ncbi:hypothetical protein BDW22DRAFT_1357892 [Trametopsis cervina]|nr:hypothetical protein BDW22DRAFT_1357892 [Trametopsis cervina]
MVSADNLNFDCLELIFAHLSGNDLVSVLQVSRSFLAAVLPQLYRTLFFHLGNGKRYPKVITAFDTVSLRPHLAVHVHNIDIRLVPMAHHGTKLHPKFMSSLIQTLQRSVNLRTFTCTPSNLLPPLITTLRNCRSLQSVRLNPQLTVEQGKLLLELKTMKSIALDGASWNVVDMLPAWTLSVKSSLTSLMLVNVQELNEPILASVLSNLPHLQGLHVIACPKIEHGALLQSLVHTPALESLSFTAWDSRTLPENIFPLSHLRHLTIDVNFHSHVTGPPIDETFEIWKHMIRKTRTWSCRLLSIMLRLSDKTLLPNSVIKELLSAHGKTLTAIGLVSCDVDVTGLRLIAKRCDKLERLAVKIPAKEVIAFADALSRSRLLHTLHDITETHTNHGTPFLNTSSVNVIMDIVPSLMRVVSLGRVWTCERQRHLPHVFTVKLEKRVNPHLTYWFLLR